MSEGELSRLGQGDLNLGHHRVGSIWVRHLAADMAFHPRLAIAAGCQLKEFPADSRHSHPAIINYRLASLGGQLRWESAGGPVLADLAFPMGLESARSAPYAPDRPFTMYCDLLPSVLSRLEAARDGGDPVFWFTLAGTWETPNGTEPLSQQPWSILVPRDMWMAFLATSGFLDIDVVEIRKRLEGIADPGSAGEYLRTAFRLLAEGDYPRAVGICRLVAEALDEIGRGKGHGDLKGLLTSCTDPKRGEQYSRLAAATKQLAALDHHHFGQKVSFSRTEALAIVRITEALVTLVGDLPQAPSV